ACIVPFAGGFAALATRVGRNFEVTVVTAIAVDAKLGRSALGLDHTGPAHAGGAARRLDAWHDLRFEPTNRVGILGCRIGKGPGSAAGIPFAPGGALGRVAGAHGKAGIIATYPVETDLGAGGCARDSNRNQQAKTEPEPIPPHFASRSRRRAVGSMLENRADTGECPVRHVAFAFLHAGSGHAIRRIWLSEFWARPVGRRRPERPDRAPARSLRHRRLSDCRHYYRAARACRLWS